MSLKYFIQITLKRHKKAWYNKVDMTYLIFSSLQFLDHSFVRFIKWRHVISRSNGFYLEIKLLRNKMILLRNKIIRNDCIFRIKPSPTFTILDPPVLDYLHDPLIITFCYSGWQCFAPSKPNPKNAVLFRLLGAARLLTTQYSDCCFCLTGCWCLTTNFVTVWKKKWNESKSKKGTSR